MSIDKVNKMKLQSWYSVGLIDQNDKPIEVLTSVGAKKEMALAKILLKVDKKYHCFVSVVKGKIVERTTPHTEAKTMYQPRWIIFCKAHNLPLDCGNYSDYIIWIGKQWNDFERETGLDRRTSGIEFDKWLMVSSSGYNWHDNDAEIVATRCFLFADAMIRAKNKKNE